MNGLMRSSNVYQLGAHPVRCMLHDIPNDHGITYIVRIMNAYSRPLQLCNIIQALASRPRSKVE